MQERENTFIPQSEADFKLMVKGAQFLLQSNDFPPEIKTHYLKFFKGLDLTQPQDIDDPKNRRIYLAAKKLLKYKENTPIQTAPGKFDENMDYVGQTAHDCDRLKDLYLRNESYQALYEGIYNGDENKARFSMIPMEDKAKADEMAEKLFDEFLLKNGVSRSELPPEMTDLWHSCLCCNSVDNEWNNWNLQINLDSDLSDSKGEQYCPITTIASHELMHVFQTRPGISESDFQNTGNHNELAPTLFLIEQQDLIYKQIHNIPLHFEVDYPKKFVIQGKEVNPGALANFFRQLKKDNPTLSYEALLTTPEAQEYIQNLVPHQKENENTQEREDSENKPIPNANNVLLPNSTQLSSDTNTACPNEANYYKEFEK